MTNKNNSGAVLITVLVMVFIVMAVVSNLAVTNFRTIKRLTNQKIQSQGYSMLKAAVDFGRAGLATSASTSSIDTLNDIWAQPLPKTTIMDDIELGGYIIDEQGKFNINDLTYQGNVNQKVLKQFTALLSSLNLPQGVASNIAYYMASPANQGDIMNQYTMGTPAYRPAGRPLIDISELLLVKGFDQSWLNKLSNYITAIPTNFQYSFNQESNTNNQTPPKGNTGTQVNVNTASAEVIAAKSGLSVQIAQRIVAARQIKPFKTNGDIITFLATNGIIIGENNTQGEQQIDVSTLSVSSKYFTIHAVVDSGSDEFKWIAMVDRANRSGQWPTILWQHPE